MNKADQKSITIQNVLETIAYAHELFNYIAIGRYPKLDLLGLSRRQYYNCLDRLIKLDLIKRKNGRYFLTLFGQVVYSIQLDLSKATDYRFGSNSRMNKVSKLVPKVELNVVNLPPEVSPVHTTLQMT